MKRIVAILAILTLLVSGCALKAPMEGMPEGSTVSVLNEDGTLSELDAMSYARKLQAQVQLDCIQYQKDQIMQGYLAIGQLEDSTERLVAVVSNQWKEAMISINGENQCKAGTNEWDAYIAYAESQGKIYEVMIAETGSTLRFGMGAFAAGWAIDSIADAMGDQIGGDQIIGGHNASKAQDQASQTVTSTNSLTETHSTQSNSMIGTNDSNINDPNASNDFSEQPVIEPEEEFIDEPVLDEQVEGTLLGDVDLEQG